MPSHAHSIVSPPATAAPAPPDRWYAEKRMAGLVRFSIAITVLNVAGHAYLGFEQSWAAPLVSLATAYTMELLAEWLEARVTGRRVRFAGSASRLVAFLLPAHITGLAVGMLLYTPRTLWAVAFAAAAAIASKYLVRVRVGTDQSGHAIRRHLLNPSNFGIASALLILTDVGVAAPYQFAEVTAGWWDWGIPLLVVCIGSLLNTRFTERIAVVAGWVGAFALQAVVRSAVHGTPIAAGLMPMSGFAFVLFTFYMVTDPATTPARARSQWIFGASVAIVYAVLMELHVVFTLFFALVVVSAGRGALLAAAAARARAQRAQPAGGALEHPRPRPRSAPQLPFGVSRFSLYDPPRSDGP
jgi:hypothetical protein